MDETLSFLYSLLILNFTFTPSFSHTLIKNLTSGIQELSFRVTVGEWIMPFLLYEKATENGHKSHDQRKEKDQLIASCFIKDQASQISPEATRKVVNRNDKTCKKTNMGQTVKPS
jgi:hypothetical protein